MYTRLITKLSPKTIHIMAALIIGTAVLARLLLIPTPMTYATDTWRQADTASIAHHFLVNGFKILYPQIYWGGNGPGYVETEFQLYPFIVAAFYAVLGEHLWLGRLVSLLFATAAFIIFYALARRLLNPAAALWALLFFVSAPLSLRYSVAFMPEAAVLFFYVAALYGFVRWLDDGRLRWLWLTAVTIALAILVKPTAIHIGLLFALLALPRYGLAVVKRREVWLAAGVAVLPAVLWYAHARQLYLTYGNTFGLFSGGDSKFGNLDYWLSPRFYLNLALLDGKWVFAGTAVILFLIGLAITLKQRQFWLLTAVAVIALYYLIVARYAQVDWGIQYHIYLLPYAALGTGLGLDWLLAQQRPRYAGPAIGLLLFVAYLGGVGRIYWGMLNVQNDVRIACAAQVAQLVPADALIIASNDSLSTDGNVPNNFEEPTLFFYSDRYGWSLPEDWYQPERLQAYQADGARYFVIYNQHGYRHNPGLVDYLKTNATQIGPGIENYCGIYELEK
jgi:4-amino-4-deoxy-L-arabinose transferase-like glycosyltransferase